MQVLTPLKDVKNAPVPDSKAKAVGKFARNYDMDASVVSDFVKPAGNTGKCVVVWTELIGHALKTREKVTQTQAGLLYAKLAAFLSTKQKDKFWGPLVPIDLAWLPRPGEVIAHKVGTSWGTMKVVELHNNFMFVDALPRVGKTKKLCLQPGCIFEMKLSPVCKTVTTLCYRKASTTTAQLYVTVPKAGL